MIALTLIIFVLFVILCSLWTFWFLFIDNSFFILFRWYFSRFSPQVTSEVRGQNFWNLDYFRLKCGKLFFSTFWPSFPDVTCTCTLDTLTFTLFIFNYEYRLGNNWLALYDNMKRVLSHHKSFENALGNYTFLIFKFLAPHQIVFLDPGKNHCNAFIICLIYDCVLWVQHLNDSFYIFNS